MTSSIGMMTFPTEWENKKWQPNHQPDKKTMETHHFGIVLDWTVGDFNVPSFSRNFCFPSLVWPFLTRKVFLAISDPPQDGLSAGFWWVSTYPQWQGGHWQEGRNWGTSKYASFCREDLPLLRACTAESTLHRPLFQAETPSATSTGDEGCCYKLCLCLVGGWATPLKNMSSSVGMIIPNLWENKTCSKPPTRCLWMSMGHQSFHRPPWKKGKVWTAIGWWSGTKTRAKLQNKFAFSRISGQISWKRTSRWNRGGVPLEVGS